MTGRGQDSIAAICGTADTLLLREAIRREVGLQRELAAASGIIAQLKAELKIAQENIEAYRAVYEHRPAHRGEVGGRP